MAEPRGHTCPECGTPRGPDGTPSCDCARRAAEAHTEARTAEAAAAEDFDPLRIRPYVEVGSAEGDPAAGPTPGDGEARTPVREDSPPIGFGSASGARSGFGVGEESAAGTARAPADGSSAEPSSEPAPGPSPVPAGPGGRSRGARRAVLLAVAGAGVALLLAAAAASGLFSYHPPARGRAAPQVRESVPDGTRASSHRSAAPSGPASRPVPPPAAPPRAPAADPTPSVSRSAPGSTSASASAPAPSRTASGTPGPSASALTLRRGDEGLEVIDLQARLSALNLYTGRIDGAYTRPVEDAVRTYQQARGIQGDALGVYGPRTRASLEGETW
ncbi:hypothetical protein GCM10010503_14360 [Streptomyces lucensis JCM 4490]|uniref:Peptidoglycan binding-like domain-containing protein n=1 Tax=Streptomyces lucensis JCM 4490 TaxID=1306176 RepID=A0A918MMN6_9ACTN|nr:peptidoglycan-binding domain-containing protein [Streptomyces lucensis]GGW39217.1 hypothetical protein GCM10010503_14360 [Streptomyces lucensis JCM 4490]